MKVGIPEGERRKKEIPIVYHKIQRGKMKDHILIKYSERKQEKNKGGIPDGAIFNIIQGFWEKNGMPLIKNKEFINLQVTKKCDMETGEDQKGE